jgi:predicted DNA-binding protein
MLQERDAATLLPGSGPSRPISTRLKVDVHDRLTALLASTGGTHADLIRRLIIVHLDALDIPATK